MERRIYMVHKGNRAKLVTNKQDAINLAKREDASIRYMPYGLYKDSRSWDYPTFHVLSGPLKLEKKGSWSKKKTVTRKRRK
jgi:hypothetical protein